MPQALTDAQRFPLLSDDGRRLLTWLREHPRAPRYNHRCGDRLTADGLRRIREFEAALQTAPPGWPPGEIPAWLMEFAAFCYREIPFYRRRGALPARFSDIPPVDRENLSREPWAFVPDSQPLDDLIVYCTSGVTGQPLDILSHPETASMYLPLLQAALSVGGVTLTGGPGRVAVALVCFQKSTYTYASLSAYLGEAGFLKINLNPEDWHASADRAAFLDDCRPEVYTGDPLSFAELAALPLRSRPRALISTAMTLLPGFRRTLEAHFECPVLDLYSMNEAGPIAAGRGDGCRLLQPRLYVEILDAAGALCPPGVRGEVMLSGGFNPFLPLLRYRTGDYACLQWRDGQPALYELEGRAPVIFRGAVGQRINNIDVSTALKPLALAQFALHQAADGALTLRLGGPPAHPEAVRAAVWSLFGAEQKLEMLVASSLAAPGSKWIQYTSDLNWEEACP